VFNLWYFDERFEPACQITRYRTDETPTQMPNGSAGTMKRGSENGGNVPTAVGSLKSPNVAYRLSNMLSAWTYKLVERLIL
jgi:hypothetical protein